MGNLLDRHGANSGKQSLQVGGNEVGFNIDFGPATSTTYTAGQLLTGLIEITSAASAANKGGLMTSAAMALNVANSAQVDVLIFGRKPTGNFTAGTALALSLADTKKLSKVYHITDWTALGAAVSWGQAPAEPRIYKCKDASYPTSLWVVAVARGSVTLAAATDGNLSIRLARS